MGKLRQPAVNATTEAEPEAPATCDDLMSLFGNGFLTEMMCGTAEPERVGNEPDSGPGLGNYTTVAGAIDAFANTPNRSLANPLNGMVLDAVVPNAGVRGTGLAQNTDRFTAGREAVAARKAAGAPTPHSPVPEAPMTFGKAASTGLAVVDTVLSAKGAYDDYGTLTNDKAGFEAKTRAAGSISGNVVGAAGGVAALAGSTTAAPLMSAYAGGSALGSTGDQRMKKSIADGGFGQSASDWASEVGHGVQESLGSGTGAKLLGGVATAGATVLSSPVVFGQGLFGMGEGMGDLACAITDCDGRFSSNQAPRTEGPSRSPEAIAARESARGGCGDEGSYDVDHWVSHGERRAPGVRLPSQPLFEADRIKDPSEALPAMNGALFEEMGGEAAATELIGEWLKNTP